jgi:hypothetical protein
MVQMVTKQASITFWNACIWTAIENISMTSGPESMKALCVGVIPFDKALYHEMAPLGAPKQRS